MQCSFICFKYFHASTFVSNIALYANDVNVYKLCVLVVYTIIVQTFVSFFYKILKN